MSHHNQQELNPRNLLIAIFLNLSIVVVEVVGGILSGSLALVADALHNLGDTASLLVSLYSFRVSNRQRDEKKTYGYRRAEVLGAFVNSLLIFITAAFILVGAIERLFSPPPIATGLLLLVATVGLLGNFFSVLLLSRDAKKSINLEASFWHILIDTFSSLVVIGGGLIMRFTGWYVVDPILSIGVLVLALRGGVRIFRRVTHILMQGAPPHIDLLQLKQRLEEIKQVENIHHLHVWSLNEQEHLAELHVVASCQSVSELDELRKTIQSVLEQEFHIFHTTIQFESRVCSDSLGFSV
ncbi:MAG: cobalt-zinc-cadmium efflux system protein [Candidatus Atribacteria bacterium]|nr:cobalt-zinc-cadmium efflux system protein [Candidatus Atribacteria bacterium]